MRTTTWTASAAMAALALGLAGCNTAPVALDDQAAVPVGSTANIDVLANDTDADADPLFVKRAWGSEKGTVTINADNTIAYKANAGASGNDTFHYRVKDNRGKAANAQVLVDLDRPLTVIEEREGVILGGPEAIIIEEDTSPDALILPGDRVLVPDTVIIENPPTAVVVTPPPSPLLDSMLVTLHTVDDDKNQGESVRILVRRGNEVLAETSAGAGELWGDGTARSFELDLRPDVPLTDIAQLKVDVIKSASGRGSGGGWVFRPEILGRLDDGKLVTVLDTNSAVKLGDGEPRDVSISLPMR